MDKQAVQLKSKNAAAPPPQNGFERGLIAEEIIGSGEIDGTQYYLIQWTDMENEPELLPSEVVKSNIPQMLIDYLEEKLKYYQQN